MLGIAANFPGVFCLAIWKGNQQTMRHDKLAIQKDASRKHDSHFFEQESQRPQGVTGPSQYRGSARSVRIKKSRALATEAELLQEAAGCRLRHLRSQQQERR